LKAVESTLRDIAGQPVRIRNTASVGGGCINPSARLEAEGGRTYFLKWNASAHVEMFAAEADGLRALAAPGTVRIPEVLGWGGSGIREDPGWLLLEYVPQGAPMAEFGERLGVGLARLHNFALHEPGPTQSSSAKPFHDPVHSVDEPFGWRRDNFIGSLPQGNEPGADWPTFWRDKRLEPQLRMARDTGHFQDARGQLLDQLLENLEDIMAGTEEDGPALLHGDLWTGNYYGGPDGGPVLIDPAVYVGAGEVDLAMMELFGSLPAGFEEGYGSLRKLAPEYTAFRRDLYQIYYLLVHVNLFGSSYVSGTLGAARRVMAGA